MGASLPRRHVHFGTTLIFLAAFVKVDFALGEDGRHPLDGLFSQMDKIYNALNSVEGETEEVEKRRARGTLEAQQKWPRPAVRKPDLVEEEARKISDVQERMELLQEPFRFRSEVLDILGKQVEQAYNAVPPGQRIRSGAQEELEALENSLAEEARVEYSKKRSQPSKHLKKVLMERAQEKLKASIPEVLPVRLPEKVRDSALGYLTSQDPLTVITGSALALGTAAVARELLHEYDPWKKMRPSWKKCETIFENLQTSISSEPGLILRDKRGALVSLTEGEKGKSLIVRISQPNPSMEGPREWDLVYKISNQGTVTNANGEVLGGHGENRRIGTSPSGNPIYNFEPTKSQQKALEATTSFMSNMLRYINSHQSFRVPNQFLTNPNLESPPGKSEPASESPNVWHPVGARSPTPTTNPNTKVVELDFNLDLP